MKERPILFSAPMVRAILDGSKTQTRRLVKCDFHSIEERDDGSMWPWREDLDRAEDHWYPCPYGQPGDRLWVRETWAAFDADWRHPGKPHDLRGGPWPNIAYRADGDFPLGLGRPSIHMPRWASRITLEITSVRVERLQDISEDDAYAEGVTHAEWGGMNAREGFRRLWESLNGTGSWDANPWVWVIEFKKLEAA